MDSHDDASSGGVWPRLIHDREWTDAQGIRWHMRGGALDRRAARKLLRRPGVRVLHVDGPMPCVLEGAAKEALMARLEGFFVEEDGTYSGFQVGDFRDDAHHVMAVVQETC